MPGWERIVSEIGPVRIINALGVGFVGIGVAQVLVLLIRTHPITGTVIDFLTLGGPGLVLMYGARRLPRIAIDPAVYPRIVRWIFGGLGAMIGIVGLLIVNPGGEITRPWRATVMAAGFGTVAGFPIGLNEAKAITRAREAEERNQELQRTQARLRETVEQLERSNERLEQFAYAASHDLQEPLRMISSYLTLVERRYADELDDDGREFIEFAVDGAERMRAMIDVLLEYSRIETQGDPLVAVALEDVLEDVLDDLQFKIEERDASITVGTLPRVTGDSSQLRQLFQNVISNAIEYSGDQSPTIHIDAERADGAWKVSVRDDGIGIEPADTERIFELFHRLHSHEEHAGTGIGLALCKRIVERHGGEIWVESTPGIGSTFYFTLQPADDSVRR